MKYTDQERAAEAVAVLKKRYPAAECALRWQGDPWRLLVMAILSAQCTDARVNLVSETLFAHYPDAASLAAAPAAAIENEIRPCGFYHTKAASLRATAILLLEDYGGTVPSDMDALLTLPGVGRKIANLIRGDVFGLPGIVADTHCIRLSGRLGFVPAAEKNPQKVERALTAVIPPEEQSDFCHRLVMFGREICSARSPRCGECPFRDTLCAIKAENHPDEKR